MMKKLLTVAALAVFVAACSHKNAPTTSTGSGNTSSTTTTTTTTTTSTSANTALIEAGHAVYTDRTKCARCHGAKDVTAYTPERWTGILKAMVPKAKLSETETEQVTAYVMANAKK
jgi:mono/diheme cytochrome c family protein